MGKAEKEGLSPKVRGYLWGDYPNAWRNLQDVIDEKFIQRTIREKLLELLTWLDRPGGSIANKALEISDYEVPRFVDTMRNADGKDRPHSLFSKETLDALEASGLLRPLDAIVQEINNCLWTMYRICELSPNHTFDERSQAITLHDHDPQILHELEKIRMLLAKLNETAEAMSKVSSR